MSNGNADQAEFWNSAQGQKWVTHQRQMDTLLDPVLQAVLDLADLKPGAQVLDVGCGSGASSAAAAQRVGPEGRVLGVDISRPMLDAAKAQAAASDLQNLDFVEADASQADLGQDIFDALISRFGVMFFADPIAAFRHISQALKPGAHLAFACWGRIDANPWFTAPAQAAKAVLGPPEKSDPDAPGPFSMRDIDKLKQTLTAAGLSDIEVTPTDILLTPPGDLHDVTALSCKIGPAARTLAYFSAGEAEEQAVIARLGNAFEVYRTPEGVRIPAEINMVSARAR